MKDKNYIDLADFSAPGFDFNEIINRLTTSSSILDCIGLLSSEEASIIEKAVSEVRKNNRKRLFSIGKDLITYDR